MDEYKDKTADTLCRTCLQLLEDESECLKHDIFLTPDLAKKLIVCTSLTVELQDGFPKNLCDCCYNKVNEFHKFQTLCVESVQRFRDMQRQQEVRRYAFEDEKPEFDLEKQAKLEITITEPEIYFRNDICKDLYTLDANGDENVNKRQVRSVLRGRGRSTSKAKTLQTVNKEPEINYCNLNNQMRSTRSQTCKLKEEKAAVERLLQVEQMINSKRWSADSTSDVGTQNNDDKWRVEDGAESENVWEEDEYEEDGRINLHQSCETAEKNTINHRSHPAINKNRKHCKPNVDESKSPKKSQVYQCEICPTRFFVEHRLVAHKRTHDGLMPYACSFKGCDKGFNRWHCLSEHLKQHNGTNQWYTCEEEGCGKVYKHKPTLSMHLRKFHKKGPELKSHVCEICGKVFKASAILNDHRYTHKDKSELPFACTEENCDRRFSSKEKLKVHMMRHAGIKNYVCPYCGMRKTTRNELKIHINYHTLERTWPCRFCQHVCNSAGNLKMHVRTVHERAKDYACRFCERTFAKPDTRKYHEMTHTGEKPNECKECGKRFTQPAALRTHRKIHLRHRNEGVAQVQETAMDSGSGNGSSVSLEISATNCMLNNAVENVTSQVTTLSLPTSTENSVAIVESQMQNFMQSS